MKIHVQRDACVGAGQCAAVAGEVFDQDDEGLVVLLNALPDPQHHEQARLAISLCPARAISATETD
jgi:ferredoxin